MKAGMDTRGYTRIALEIGLEVERVSDQQQRKGRTQNISMDGLLIHCETPFSHGTECIVKLFAGGSESDILVHARVKVVYVNDAGMGVQILSHLDLDSYDHLHKLVLYNADTDVETVESEINAHLDKIRGG